MPRVSSGALRCLYAAIAALAIAAPAAAQSVTGSIGGTVADQQKQVIPGATITITHEATNESRSTTSESTGDFQLTNLMPGRYTVKVVLEGFRTLERKNIVLSAGERLAIGTLSLDVGGVGETVVVEAKGT